MALAPYARVSWVHEFKPDRAINASFIALPAAAFTVDGPRAASDAARIDAGAKLAIGPNAAFRKLRRRVLVTQPELCRQGRG
jgi:uncharacterized protein with beta-barrel porin domain